MELGAYIEMMRLPNAVMGAIAVAIGFVVASNTFVWDSTLIYGLVAVIAISSGGMVVNDFFDRKIDKRNKPHRPIPSGRVKEWNALVFSIGLFVFGVLVAMLANEMVAYVALVTGILLVMYSRWLARMPLVGNCTVALSTGLTFVLGEAIALGTIFSPGIAVLFAVAFFSTLGREIYKSIEDMKADREERKTLPMVVGMEKSGWLAGGFLALSVGASPVPYLLGLFGWPYLAVVAVADALLIYAAVLAFGQKRVGQFKRQADIVKYAQFVALLAFIVGIF